MLRRERAREALMNRTVAAEPDDQHAADPTKEADVCCSQITLDNCCFIKQQGL
jgi:hypothetical protein